MMFTHRLWDREYSKLIDQLSIEKYGINELTLMENAGKSVFQQVIKISKKRPVIILAGHNNNGADALVTARYLNLYNISTYIFLVGHNKPLSKGCTIQLEKLKKIKKINIYNYSKGSILKLKLKNPIIVDGIFGIGIKGKLKDDLSLSALKEAAEINPSTVIAVDVPSGMDIDNPGYNEIPLSSDICISFGGIKPAQVIAPTNIYCNKIVVKDIKFAKEAIAIASKTLDTKYELVDIEKILNINIFEKLSPNAHKYDRGHILIIGGSYGKIGACILCGHAALKSGCGWVTIALSRKTLQDFSSMISAPTEITFENLFDNSENIDSKKLQRFIEERIPKAIIIGPGFIKQEINEQVLEILLDYSNTKNGFLVFDAGAIHGIKNLLGNKKFNINKTLVTPHPKEWLKIDLDKPLISPLYINNLQELGNISKQTGITLCYKSSTPMVIEFNGSAKILNIANNILAKAGSGDVLAGIIAVHGINGLDASVCFLRSQAILFKSALLAAKDYGNHSILATDIIKKIGFFI